MFQLCNANVCALKSGKNVSYIFLTKAKRNRANSDIHSSPSEYRNIFYELKIIKLLGRRIKIQAIDERSCYNVFTQVGKQKPPRCLHSDIFDGFLLLNCVNQILGYNNNDT